MLFALTAAFAQTNLLFLDIDQDGEKDMVIGGTLECGSIDIWLAANGRYAVPSRAESPLREPDRTVVLHSCEPSFGTVLSVEGDWLYAPLRSADGEDVRGVSLDWLYGLPDGTAHPPNDGDCFVFRDHGHLGCIARLPPKVPDTCDPCCGPGNCCIGGSCGG